MGTSTEALDRPATGEVRQKKTAEEIFGLARARELALSRLLMAYITAGLIFMLFPGTLLGVGNLMQFRAS